MASGKQSEVKPREVRYSRWYSRLRSSRWFWWVAPLWKPTWVIAMATAGIAVVVLAAAVSWWLLVPAADWLARHDVGSAKGPLLQTARDAARGRLLTLGAGLFAAGVLVYTARTFGLSRQGQVTDRYAKAIEQLGSDKLDVRIGGIYALERVARDSKRDHPTVMEVLAAFIREHSHEQWPPPDPGGQQQDRSTRPDVQAAATVIGRRNAPHDIPGRLVDLTGADLRGADLRGAVLTHTRLTRVYLHGADLSGADLHGADLAGADLTRVYLIGADLHSADLTTADLHGADLTGALMEPDAVIPPGWQRATDSGRLTRADTSSGGTTS
jgi:hypothetical protein